METWKCNVISNILNILRMPNVSEQNTKYADMTFNKYEIQARYLNLTIENHLYENYL